MKSEIYRQAKYYEIAFSFIDAKKQIRLFEKFIIKYSTIKVSRVLDIACGTALQLREFARNGYEAVGLDFSANMLTYLKEVADAENMAVETIQADMNNFKLKKPVDFAYIMMGSIIYTQNNERFLSHLNSVAASLKPGGLYIIENMAIDWTNPKFFKPQTWTMRKGKTKVKTTYQITPKNSLAQLVAQSIKLDVMDNGKHMEFVDTDDLKIILPEELKLLVEKNGKFEFIDFFERNSLKVLKNASSDNLVVLRKK